MNRRRLIQVLSCLPAISLVPSVLWADAKAAPANLQSETEGLGQAMQYKHDASKVKHPMFKKGSSCENCVQFNVCGAGDTKCKPLSAADLKKADYAACTIFPNKVVAKKGWCMSWGPKA